MSSKLWFPPQLHHDASAEEERKVTWLELFYDLVYVATLIQLGNTLSEDVTWAGFLRFAALFVPIWWAWSGITFYVNRFVVDDVWHRLLILVQIFFIAILGVSVEGAFGALAAQFALAYAGIRVILVLLYVRTYRHVPDGRPLIKRYIAFFSVGAALWIISAFVPPPFNYYLWLAAILVDFSVSLSPTNRRLQSTLPPDPPHMVERYGIFTIIVLGESFIKTITAASGFAVTTYHILFTLFGVAVVFALWWLYFDDVEESYIKPVSESRAAPYVWIYSHLPLAIGLTAFGVAAKKLFLEAPGEAVDPKYRLLYAGALVIYALALAAIDLVTERHDPGMRNRTRAYVRVGMAAVFLILAFVPAGINAVTFVILAAVVMAIQVAVELLPTRRAASHLGTGAAD